MHCKLTISIGELKSNNHLELFQQVAIYHTSTGSADVNLT